jgi:sulfonate transport system permease protein
MSQTLRLPDGALAEAAPTSGPLPAQAWPGAWLWRALRPWLLPWAVPLLLLLLWWVAARQGWVAPQVLPSPEDVGTTLAELVRSGEMADNLWISAQRVLFGFGVGATAGLLLGVGMGLSPRFKDYVYPLFKAFSQVPVLGWLPLLMLLVGIDEALKIILISKAALVPVALNTAKGIENVPNRYVEVARVFGFTIVYGRQLFQLDVVMAAVIVVGAVGFALDKLLALVELRLLRWRRVGF